MSNNTPGPSDAVQLVPNPKPLKLELCLICQNVKDSAGSFKLISTDAGRQTIISTSRKLEDGLVTSIDPNRLVDIRYHVKSCYGTYKKKGARHKVEIPKRKPEEPDLPPLMSLITRPKRSKTITSPDPTEKPCVICNHVKCQGDTKSFRIESSEVAGRLLKVANFNKDEIHIRLIFLKETGNVWAKDIICHNSCMNKYISKFQRDVEKLLADDFENPGKLNHIEEAFNDVINSLDISTNGDALSDVRDTLNKKLKCHGKA